MSGKQEQAVFRRFLPPLILIGVGLCAYLNSWAGAFVFDDVFLQDALPGADLWSVARWFRGARPVVEATFAADYALHGMSVAGYHVFNMLVHLTAGLALYGVVRRTLASPRLSERFGAVSSPLALVVALVWVVHPLQTQAVTYVIQRGESLMGMFYLLTLYGAVRAFFSVAPARWWLLATLSCVLGMGCKQVMVTAPLAVLLYDALFVSRSVRELWRRSWGLYVGLGVGWVALGILLALMRSHPSAGFGMPQMTSWQYARTQPGVIWHYLRLAFWPHPLCLDYLWPVAYKVRTIAPPMIALAGLLAATAWALWKRAPAAFPAVWFFLLLAPTSSVMPIADLCVEHRMYLPLAAVVALVIPAAWLLVARLSVARPARREAIERSAAALALLLIAGLTTLTALRNHDYRSPEAIWRDVLRQRPNNARAHINIGKSERANGRPREALEHYRRVIALAPRLPEIPELYYNMGNAHLDLGEPEEAGKAYFEAARLRPDYYQAHAGLGKALARQEKMPEAAVSFKEALRLNPNYANAWDDLVNLGRWLAARGRFEEAASAYRAVIAVHPASFKAHNGLAIALARGGKTAEAVEEYEAALRLAPDEAEALFRLAWLRATTAEAHLRDGAAAVRLAERGVQLAGDARPELLDVLAAAYAEAGRFDEAVATARQSVAAAARDGKPTEAIRRRLALYEARRPWRDPDPRTTRE